MLLTRSLSIKFCVELWAQGEGYSQSHTNLQQSSFVTTSGTKWFGEHVSFKVHIESFNKKLTGEDKLGRIESLSYLPLQGPVKLTAPTWCSPISSSTALTRTICPRSRSM